jgi:hypothetical protein
MELLEKISLTLCCGIRDTRGVSAREFLSIPFLEPAASSQNKRGLSYKYIDRECRGNLRDRSEIAYYVLDSTALNSGTQSKIWILTQNLPPCKPLQGKFLIPLFSRTWRGAKSLWILTGVKSIENNGIRRKVARNLPVLTILGVSITISTFTKRRQKRARVHLGLYRRLRCFGKSEGWDNVYAIKLGNHRLSGTCHALLNETTRTCPAFLGC